MTSFQSVAGFMASPAFIPFSLIALRFSSVLPLLSRWIVSILLPAFAKSGISFVGSVTIRCVSKYISLTLRIAATTLFP